MTVTATCLLESKDLEASQTTQLTAASAQTILIDKATITNHTSSSATVAINVVASGGAAAASNLVLQTKSIPAADTYLCPELVGQTLRPGDFVSTIAGTATALTMRISGRVVE
jgi:hypothetical protein